MILVDTNGFKGPNKYGRDRWLFTLQDRYGERLQTGLPEKIGFFVGDRKTVTEDCHYPPCYFKSWLYE